MKKQPSLFLLVSALLGAFIGTTHAFSLTPLLILGCVGLVLIVIPRPFIKIVGGLVVLATIVAINAQAKKAHYQQTMASIVKNETFFGTVVDVRAISGFKKLVEIRSADAMIHATLLDAASALTITPGQRVHLKAALTPFLPPLSFIDFDQFSYGLSHGIHARAFIKDPEKILLGEPEKSLLSTWRYDLRTTITRHLTPHQSSLLLALIFGETDLFLNPQKQLYQDLGIQHLLAVSGLQVSMLGGLCFCFFFGLFSLLPAHYAITRLRLCVIFSIIAIWVFVALCHCPRSAVRAGLMSTIALFPVFSGRKIDWLTIFCTSGFLTLVFDPLSIKDIGCLLSYAATFGLFLTHHLSSSWLATLYARSRMLWLLCSYSCVTMGAFLATLPIISCFFGTWTPSSLLANLVLVPLATIVQIPSILLGMIGAALKSPLFLKAAAFFASIIEIISETLRKSIGGVSFIASPSSSLIFISSFALFLVFIALLRRRFIIASACFSVALLSFFMPHFFKSEDLRIHVLSVGQGDATVVQMPSGHTMLIDAGGQAFGDFDPGASIVLPTLKRLGIKQLDVVAISHPDPDHINGVFALFEAIPIKEIWHSGFKPDHPLTTRLIREAQQRSIAIKNTHALLGAHQFGATRVTVLGPKTTTEVPYFSDFTSNDNSLVIAIEHEQKRMLWPGDIEKKAEQTLLAQGAHLKADIIKAPHHGSRTSSTTAFIDKVAPDYVIFSTGRNNRFSFPHDDVVQRYHARNIATFDTAVDGHIIISISKKGIDIAGFSSTCHKDGARSCLRKGQHYERSTEPRFRSLQQV